MQSFVIARVLALQANYIVSNNVLNLWM